MALVANISFTSVVSQGSSLFQVSTATPQPARAAPPDYVLTTMFVCERVLLPLICSLGILGNGLSLCVLTRREMAAPTTCFLTAMAVSDLILLTLQIPMFLGYNSAVAHDEGYKIFHRFFTIVRYVLNNVFITSTCWLTVAVTSERFLSLRFMFHPRLTCTVYRARIVIIAIFVSSFVFHFAKFFEYVPNPDLKSPRPIIPTELVLNPTYDTYVHGANIALTSIIPVVVLVVANSFLIYFLITHRRRMLRHRKASTASAASLGAASSSNGGHSNACTASNLSSVDMMHVSAIVVATVLVFLACHSVGVFVALTIASRGRHWVFARPGFVAMKHINTVLIMLNSSVNFLLYCAISRKFRKVFTRLFRRWLTRCGASAAVISLTSRREPWTSEMPLSDSGPGSAHNTLTRSSRGPMGSFRYHNDDCPPPSYGCSVGSSKVYTSSSKSGTSNGSYSNEGTTRADV